jgi:hypothetical protein
MGGCCMGRNANEVIFDDFFNKMKLTEECTNDMSDLLDFQIDGQGNFYKGIVENFLKSFCENHLAKENEKVNIEHKNYFEFLYNTALHQKKFFELSSLIILLSKCEDDRIDVYSESILKLAQRFNIQIKDGKEILKINVESLIDFYISAVSTNAVVFAKSFSGNPHEFNNTFTKIFNEENVLNLRKELMNGWEKESLILPDFIRSNYSRLNHSHIRQHMIDNSKVK